ncbi:hypothetical protein TrCOL_g1558 [Triparma columacea]|uniref:Methyltransferase type 11 domain-containing protein n=1 Tax=Triparma columacea TaxID=722753 RepID=A0A9W7G5J0_9STRA|nr:hypothetical protein TrCOL_g1558 [Triparma columacea]
MYIYSRSTSLIRISNKIHIASAAHSLLDSTSQTSIPSITPSRTHSITHTHSARRGYISRTFAYKEKEVFDQSLKLLHKDNAARLRLKGGEEEEEEEVDYTYFNREITNRLVDRLEDVKDRDFTICLDLGTPDNALLASINREESLSGNGGGIGGVRKIVQLQGSAVMASLHEDEGAEKSSLGEGVGKGPAEAFRVPDSTEFSLPLPFPSDTFDCVISSMALHWVSDLQGTLREINRVLKPDGAVFLAVPGGETLPELRSSLLMAEQERDGGVSVRTGPYVSVPDVGRLLQSSGFNLPTIDVDEVLVEYPSMFVLTEHLGRMGESNGSTQRRTEGNSVNKWLAAAAVYGETFKGEGGEGVTASVQVIYGIGWKKHDSQQKPDERGKAGVGKIGEDVRVEQG